MSVIADQMTDNVVVKIDKLIDLSDETLTVIMKPSPETEAKQTAAAAKVQRMERAVEAVRKLREL
jgi:hypothetical protein